MWHTTSLPAGSRDRMIPLATIWESQRIGAPSRSAARHAPTMLGLYARDAGRSVCPAAWIILTATCATSGGSEERSASS